jgi:hypothetical protein
VGIVKPVYMTRPKIRMAAGVNAETKDLESEAMDLKNMDITRVSTNEMRTKKKKAPGSLRRWVMK